MSRIYVLTQNACLGEVGQKEVNGSGAIGNCLVQTVF